MNYIKHLSGFFDKVSKDDRLNPTHISMYVSLFQFWNACRFHNPISISRNEVMKVSKIASKATYHKCIRELNDFGYLSYQPSYNPFKGSLVYLFDFEPASKQAKHSSHTKSETSSEQAVVSYTNNSNITKQETVTNEFTKNNSHEGNANSENDSSQPASEKEKKFREKKEKGFLQGSERPLLQEVKDHFALNAWPELEAQKFYNHYESNGWLIGGKSLMVNWHASAANWILNSNHFNPDLKAGKLHATGNKNYSEPL